ncbi:hypothetical protein GPJ61_16675 [Brevibacillus formosus]|nr:hypothetical protein [Brevibacillus formosus]
MNGGLLRIRESLHYILANPDEVIRLSIKELAERSESSQAAIIRMCKSIGFAQQYPLLAGNDQNFGYKSSGAGDW